MKKTEIRKKQRQIPYSIGIISLACIAASVIISIVAIVTLKNTNGYLEEKINAIEMSIANFVQNSDDSIFQLSFEQLKNEIAVLDERHNSFVDALAIVLSVFGLIVTACTVIMPIFTYNFLQKDQVESLLKITKKRIKKMKEDNYRSIEKLNSLVVDTQNQTNTEIKKIIETEEQFEKWFEDFFSPLDFNEIRIEPVYNISSDEIESYYRKACMNFTLGKSQVALEIFNAILQSNPKHVKTLLAKSQVLCALADYNESLTTINILIDNDDQTDYYYIRGCIKYKAKNYDAAIMDFNYVYLKEPHNEQNLIKLAAALHKKRRTKEAVKYQSEAIQLNGNIAQYYADRGIMYHALKEYPNALADKKQAISLAKDNWQYYGICAATLYKTRDYTEAINYADKAINNDNSLAFVYSFRGLIKSCLADKYSSSDAIEDLNKAINLDCNNHRNYIRRAEFYTKKLNFGAAIADLNEAQKIDSSDPEIFYMYAEVYQKLGNPDLSKDNMEKALSFGYISE